MTTPEQTSQVRWQRVCAVLDAVFDAPESEREQVLAAECGGDAGLRAEVDAMLAAEAVPDLRVDTPAAHWAGDVLDHAETASAQVPGQMIGDYRLLRELGRGGMGSVWLAERAGPEFEQQVALKLLKRGLDTDLILARFYDERRILARLRHPHIALFLDGGVADTGQPWFTMEWVDGAPITEWCDTRKLGIRERIVLFLDAVAAVQYAHQQLVVHRDLKPGNVLVSESGAVKLLDFGIAKMLDAAEGRAEVATMTRMGVRMLTPGYAAPEQVRGDPATTATDVHALGVLLGELLTGKRPPSTSPDAAQAHTRRPSTGMDAAAAALRGSAAERLRRQLRGDLDTIVLKALQPEPQRRYGSAQAFGEDLQRWLDGQPVQARPDSAWYRLRRFVGRHRLGTAAAAVMVISLTIGAAVATWQAREAQRQAVEARRQAQEAEKQTRRAEQVKDFLVGIFHASNPDEWKGKEPTARDLLDIGARRVDQELQDDPMLHAQMQRVIGELALSNGDFERAEALFDKSTDEVRKLTGDASKEYANALHSRANLLYLKGDYAGASQAVEHEIAILQHGFAQHPDMAQALAMLASIKQLAGNVDAAIELRKQALDIIRHAQGTADRDYADQLLQLGQLLVMANRIGEARPLLDESLNVSKALYGPDSALFANALNGQAKLMSDNGDLERAIAGFRAAADIYHKARANQELLTVATNEGHALCRMGRFAEAERSYREAAQAQERFASRNQADLLNRSLGRCLSDAGWYARAEPLLRDASGLAPANASTDRNFVLGGTSLLLRLLVRQGRTTEAIALAARVQRDFGPVHGADSWHAAIFLAAAAPAWFAREPARGVAQLRGAVDDLRRANAPVRTISSAMLDLAELELHAGHAQEADAQVRQIEDSLDGGRQGPLGLRATMLRGVASMQLGRLAEADGLLRQALEARRTLYGEDNPWSGEARMFLGICEVRAGKRDEGRALIRQGRAQFTRESGENHFVVTLADETLRAPAD